MTDVTLISLGEAAKHFPRRDGKKLHVKSIRRRITKGHNGIRLRAIKDGNRWYTSREWVEQFLEQVTAKAAPCGQIHPDAAKERYDRAKKNLQRRYGINVG